MLCSKLLQLIKNKTPYSFINKINLQFNLNNEHFFTIVFLMAIPFKLAELKTMFYLNFDIDDDTDSVGLSDICCMDDLNC